MSISHVPGAFPRFQWVVAIPVLPFSLTVWPQSLHCMKHPKWIHFPVSPLTPHSPGDKITCQLTKRSFWNESYKKILSLWIVVEMLINLWLTSIFTSIHCFISLFLPGPKATTYVWIYNNTGSITLFRRHFFYQHYVLSSMTQGTSSSIISYIYSGRKLMCTRPGRPASACFLTLLFVPLKDNDSFTIIMFLEGRAVFWI